MTYENNLLGTNKDFYTFEDTPDSRLLSEIRKTPKAVSFLPPFLKSFIIKPGHYSNLYRSLWRDSILVAGDSALKVCVSRYFSIAQFTFLTKRQYLEWKRVESKLIRSYNVSFELFFLNPDGTLNYTDMINIIDAMIRDGVYNPLKKLDPSRHINRIKKDTVVQHHQALTMMKDRLRKKLKSDMFENADEWEDETLYD